MKILMPALLVITLLSIHGCGGSAGDYQAQSSDSPKQLANVMVVSSQATFGGARADYSVVKTVSGYTVTDTLGREGVANLTNVQTLIFSDVTLNLGIAEKASSIPVSELNTLVELYVAFFNRVPDADGLSYWIDQFKAGASIEQIANSFYVAGVQNSAQTGYSASMTNEDFIKLVYKNVLGRTTVDDTGLAYWRTSLENGSKSRGALVTSILTAAHTFKDDPALGWVATLLENKRLVSLNFAVTQGLNFRSAADAITKATNIAALVTPTDRTTAIKSIERLVVVPTAVANTMPIGNAGLPQTVIAGTTVKLDGLASRDDNGDALAFKWLLTSAPLGNTSVLSSEITATPTIQTSLPGNYIFSLVVNDGKALSIPSFVLVTATKIDYTTIPVSQRYTCSIVSKSAALLLYAQGHTYLDRDGDAKPCEASDIYLETAPIATAPVTTPTSTVGSGRPTCYTGPRGGTYTITSSGGKNYGGC